MLLFSVCPVLLVAQTPFCGKTVVTASGSATETRFIPASPSHVRDCARKALFLVVAKPVHETDTTIVAKNYHYGVNDSRMVFEHIGYGTFHIEFAPDSMGDVPGTRVAIDFRKMAGINPGWKGLATPLMDEIACLAKVLTPGDPKAAPAGIPKETPRSEHRSVALPEGTPVRLVLTDTLTARALSQHPDDPIVLQVSDDVVVDGEVVVRRGALGIGKVLAAKANAHWGRGGMIEFEVRSVTAADGQVINTTGDNVKTTGVNDGGNPTLGVAGGVATLGLSKGAEAYVRGGSGYTVRTIGQHTIEPGK